MIAKVEVDLLQENNRKLEDQIKYMAEEIQNISLDVCNF